MRELLLIGLAAAALCRGGEGDLLASLERSAAPSATKELHALYQRTKSPDQRLWLVDALYGRAQTHKDPAAIDALLDAAEDKNLDVKRRALSALAGFRLFPEQTVRARWLARLRDLASRAEADADAGMNAAGLNLKQMIVRWEADRRGGAPQAAVSPDEAAPQGEPVPRRGIGIFLWIVSVQLMAYAWQKIGFFLLQQSGEAGRTLSQAWGHFERRPALVLFPVAGITAMVLLLGFLMARVFFLSAVPLQVSGVAFGWTAGLKTVLEIYLIMGLLAYIPAALLGGYLTGPGGRSKLGPLLSRVTALTSIGLFALIVAWPLELLASAVRFKRLQTWSARIGSPLAALLAGVVMLREGLGARAAWRRASALFRDADPGAALLAKTWLQPQFIVLCLAAPAMLALSLVPSMVFAGFRPTRLFALWFISDATFCVGFGVWAGILMIGAAYALILSVGGAYAAQRYGAKAEA